MKYQAITIDTSIFDKYGRKLESGLLNQLTQFGSSPVWFVISEVVKSELYRHILDSTFSSKTKVKGSISSAAQHQLISEEKRNDLIEMFEIDPEVVARERIDRYLKSVDATVVPAKGHVDIDELLRIYFEGTAPFSKEGKKKNEFPDAIALLSLEDWARNNAATLIAVSTDKDWISYGETSDYIDVVEDLSEALSCFQSLGVALEFLTNSFFCEPPSNIPDAVHLGIESNLKDELITLTFEPNATGGYFTDPEDIVEFQDIQIEFGSLKENKDDFTIVSANDDEIAFEAPVIVTATASCRFSLHTMGSNRSEYVGISTAVQNVDLEMTILISLRGDFSLPDVKDIEGTLELEEAEFVEYVPRIEFGDLVPDE